MRYVQNILKSASNIFRLQIHLNKALANRLTRSCCFLVSKQLQRIYITQWVCATENALCDHIINEFCQSKSKIIAKCLFKQSWYISGYNCMSRSANKIYSLQIYWYLKWIINLASEVNEYVELQLLIFVLDYCSNYLLQFNAYKSTKNKTKHHDGVM